MNRLRKVLIIVFAICLLAGSSMAMAAPNISAIEKSWLEFQKTVSDQMVKDGEMTRQDADQKITALQKKMSETSEDVVYKRIKEKCPQDGCRHGKEGRMLKAYAEMTNRSVEDVKKVCEEAKFTIWELAKREGKLDEFKAKIIEKKTAWLDGLVKEGKLTQQKRDEKLKHMKEKLDMKS